MRIKQNVIFFAALMTWAVLGSAAPRPVWALEAINKVCPVMPDHKANGKAFAEYKGKKYGFCCKSCIKKFNKDPEKSLARLAKQDCQGETCP